MIVECPGCHLRYDVTGRPPGTRARCRCGALFSLPEAAEDAGSLACPSCGAPSPPSAKQCTYCGTGLATARCARCFALLFRGVKHCGQCGARTEVPARAVHEQGQSERACPRCSERAPRPMVAHIVAGTLLDQCDACGGIWLDQTAFERLTEEGGKQGDALRAVGGLPRPRSPLGPASRQVVYLKCPDCEQRMARRNFARRSGVIIDVCNAHGIWFDDEELTRILEFVRAGGLQDARRRDLEELEEEERRVRAQRQIEMQRGIWSGRSDYFDESRAGAEGLVGVVSILSEIL